jgi:hypothetical protein
MKKKHQLFLIIFLKITTIAYNLKGCLSLFFLNFNFVFLISQNLAKYAYGQLQLEQPHKIE